MEILDEKGNYTGLVADYMRLIEKRIGFRFKIVRTNSWSEVLELAQKRAVDVLSAAYDTPERRHYMTWTKPYLEVPEVIVTRKSWGGDLTLKDLMGMKVGVTRDYYVVDYIRKKYPEINLILVPNDLAGLRMVSFGGIDAMVAELPLASYSLEKEKITNLRVAGKTEYSAVLSIGVRNDWPVLAAIMEKGLASVSPAERKEIYNRWINLGAYPFYYSRRFWYALISAAVGGVGIVLLVLAWNLTLRRKVALKTHELTFELEERRRIENALETSQQRLKTLIGNLPGMAYRHWLESEDQWPFDYTSDGCFELTGYKSLCQPGRETFYYDHVIHPQDRRPLRMEIKKALANREPFRLIYRINTADKRLKWVWEQGVGIYDDNGDIAHVEGFVTDITEYKKAEESLSQSKQLFQDLVDNSLIGIRDKTLLFQRG